MVEQIRSATLCFEAQLAVNQWVTSSSLVSGAIFFMETSGDTFYSKITYWVTKPT
jgi:hypothetical protein